MGVLHVVDRVVHAGLFGKLIVERKVRLWSPHHHEVADHIPSQFPDEVTQADEVAGPGGHPLHPLPPFEGDELVYAVIEELLGKPEDAQGELDLLLFLGMVSPLHVDDPVESPPVFVHVVGDVHHEICGGPVRTNQDRIAS